MLNFNVIFKGGAHQVVSSKVHTLQLGVDASVILAALHTAVAST